MPRMIKKLPDKFYGKKPLKKFSNDYYPDKMNVKYTSFEPLPKNIFNIYDTIEGKKVEERDYDINLGINSQPEQFTKYDFLSCTDGPAFIVHERVVRKMSELCPDDFQAFPVTIKNRAPKYSQPFENKDFYLINILHLVDIIDKEKSIIDASNPDLHSLKCAYFKENCMNGHLIARDKTWEPMIFFHPKLAREFVKSKGVQFLSDEELPDKPYHDELWSYIHRFYAKFLKQHGAYEEFIKGGNDMSQVMLQRFKDDIFINYCPNCGNLKLTPMGRQCLKCGQFIDPVR